MPLDRGRKPSKHKVRTGKDQCARLAASRCEANVLTIAPYIFTSLDHIHYRDHSIRSTMFFKKFPWTQTALPANWSSRNRRTRVKGQKLWQVQFSFLPFHKHQLEVGRTFFVRGRSHPILISHTYFLIFCHYLQQRKKQRRERSSASTESGKEPTSTGQLLPWQHLPVLASTPARCLCCFSPPTCDLIGWKKLD